MGEQVGPPWAGLPISESHDVQPEWKDWCFFVTPSMPSKPKELAAPTPLLTDEDTKVQRQLRPWALSPTHWGPLQANVHSSILLTNAP